jgi:hypothetical protein
LVSLTSAQLAWPIIYHAFKMTGNSVNWKINIMELTAGRRFETAVPDDVMTTAGMWEPLPYPTAWNASERSSKHEMQVINWWLAAATASGEDLDPGATQKY